MVAFLTVFFRMILLSAETFEGIKIKKHKVKHANCFRVNQKFLGFLARIRRIYTNEKVYLEYYYRCDIVWMRLF